MRKRLTKATLILTVALAAVAALALPASAHGGHVAVFQGTAAINGPALGFPNNPAVTTRWAFEATPSHPSTPGVCVTAAGNCDLFAEGDLGAVATVDGNRLGGWCGLSRGWDGDGYARADDEAGSDSHDLDQVGWIASAGSLLVIDGQYLAEDGDNGLIVGLVQASGSNLFQDCLDGTTTSFTVTGVAALLVN